MLLFYHQTLQISKFLNICHSSCKHVKLAFLSVRGSQFLYVGMSSFSSSYQKEQAKQGYCLLFHYFSVVSLSSVRFSFPYKCLHVINSSIIFFFLHTLCTPLWARKSCYNIFLLCLKNIFEWRFTPHLSR